MTIDFAPLKAVITSAANTYADLGQANRILAIGNTLEEFWDQYSAGLNARDLAFAFYRLGTLKGANDDVRIESRRKTCVQIHTWMWDAYPEMEGMPSRADKAKVARNWLAVAQSINLFEADNRQKAIAMTAMREAQEFLGCNEYTTAWHKFESTDKLLQNTTYEFLLNCGTRFFGSLKTFNAGEVDKTVQLVDTWGDRFEFDDVLDNVTHYRFPAKLPEDA